MAKIWCQWNRSNPEYEGKKTSPQAYVRDVIRRQLKDLCRQKTQQAQARQRKRFDKKAAGAKACSVGDYVRVFQNVILPKGTKKEGTVHDYGGAPGGTLL